MATSLHVLFEHASGYAIFRACEFEEVAMFLPQVESSIGDLSKFNSIIKLVAFTPFKSGTNALDNINSISEGLIHEDLRCFLEANVPKSTKNSKSVLGLGDRKLADAIGEEMHISCQFTGVVPEIIRGIRVHFHSLVRGLTEQSAGKAQLGLGHSYSRAKVKFNVNRIDNMIIQSISLMDQLDKDVNTFSMRIREWYSYHFPELIKIVPDNYNYARVVKLIKNRKELSPDVQDEMEEIVMDGAKVKAIYDASRQSMGMDISPIDMINIEVFATRVIALAEYRKSLHVYLKSKMAQVAPNVAALIGEQVGARLISHAGSLTNLAKYPASTVQVLGAEKALFRALKTKGNTPKYGLIFHSTFIGRAAAANKGRISRYLANKCSMASRIDCFSDYPTSIYGEHLKQQVEDRLKFFETGEAPTKNVDVMKKAMAEANDAQEKLMKLEKKKKKKEKRKLQESMSAADTTMETTLDISGAPEAMEDDEPVKKKKKKSKKAKVSENDLSVNTTMDTSHGISDDDGEPQIEKRKKKKRSKNAKESENDHSLNTTMDTSHGVSDDDGEPQIEKRKKKKKRSKNAKDSENDHSLNTTMDTSQGVSDDEDSAPPVKKQKKKKKKHASGE